MAKRKAKPKAKLSGKQLSYGKKKTKSRSGTTRKAATSRSRATGTRKKKSSSKNQNMARPKAATRRKNSAAKIKTKNPTKKKSPSKLKGKGRSAGARKSPAKGKNPNIIGFSPSGKSSPTKIKGRGKKVGDRDFTLPDDFDFEEIPVKIKPLPRPVKTGLTADRKMELGGIGLALIGLLTVFSLLSSINSTVTGTWISFLRRTVGGGVYLLPLVLILVGVWMIVRNFERVPQLDVERILGMGLLFINILVIFHLWVSLPGAEAAYLLASTGGGGGYIGAWFMVFLESRLGIMGLVVALFAWFLVGLSMALDVSIPTLFKWVSPTMNRVKKIKQQVDVKRSGGASVPSPAADGFSPISKTVSVSGSPDELTATPPTTPTDSTKFPSALPSTQLPLEPATDSKTAPKVTPGKPKQKETVGMPGSNMVPEVKNWVLPDAKKILEKSAEVSYSDDHDRNRANIIEETLSSFGAPAHVIEINRGPTITQYGVEPDFIETRNGRTRVRVGKIAALADDLSLALAASRIRIQAPVPGKGYVGIEVPNEQIAVVSLRDVVENTAFTRLKSNLRFALGQDVAGNAVAANLAGMPHLLVAGATGSGKSVFVNALIAGLLLHNTPETLRMIMIDPKRVELTNYNGIPHLLAPVVTEIDRVVGVLQWVTREMDSRYQRFADVGSRNIEDFNKKIKKMGGEPIPYLVLMIDELADMMMIAPDQTERLITRMAQLARATGIHLVISTQRPSVDVVTGLIKANFPARISFAVASGTDSRVILDQPGAERLLGRGDMLFQAPDAPAPIRLQGVFVSDSELHEIVRYWRAFGAPPSTAPVATSTPLSDSAPASNIPLKQLPIWEEMEEEVDRDVLYNESVDIVRRKGRASISMLQRRLRIGYTRSARIIELMETEGIIGPALGGSKAREILDYGPAAPPVGED